MVIMNTLKLKANIGMAMVILFAITLISGIVLHLKKHGLLIEPRDAIKVVHWTGGFAMCGLAIIHRKQFGQFLAALKHKAKWFYLSTRCLELLLTLVALTGAVKLLSPVKIPNLGLLHYGLGLAMGLAAIVHLLRGLPSWNRLRKTCK